MRCFFLMVSKSVLSMWTFMRLGFFSFQTCPDNGQFWILFVNTSLHDLDLQWRTQGHDKVKMHVSGIWQSAQLILVTFGMLLGSLVWWSSYSCNLVTGRTLHRWICWFKKKKKKRREKKKTNWKTKDKAKQKFKGQNFVWFYDKYTYVGFI